jgi:molecular chaperone DnaK (HSP70)
MARRINVSIRCTGVAWTYSRKPDDANVIQSWPGGLGDKVPSTIIYHKDGRTSWGFEAPPEDPSTLQWFKLLLMDEKDMKPEVRSHPYVLKARKAIEQSAKQPREVVSDYLALVWGHAIDNIVNTKRRTIVDALPFRVVLTVPAIWGRFPHVIRKLREAARQAGILNPRSGGDTELSIVAEPEAAAFATLKDGEGEYMLQRGDIFVMCDAGGGTVVCCSMSTFDWILRTLGSHYIRDERC